MKFDLAGFSEQGKECIDALLTRVVKKGTADVYDLKSIFQDTDAKDYTVFDYARENCSQDTLDKLLATVDSGGAQFQEQMY